MDSARISGYSAHLLQHLTDVLAPQDEEDDDDQQQDDGHQAANQNRRVNVIWRVTGWWTGCCREGKEVRDVDLMMSNILYKLVLLTIPTDAKKYICLL